MKTYSACSNYWFVILGHASMQLQEIEKIIVLYMWSHVDCTYGGMRDISAITVNIEKMLN